MSFVSPEQPETNKTQAGLFIDGLVTLHSGSKATWKIDCDSLTDSDINTLARLISERVGNFSSVEGIPRGGLRLALALQQYISDTGPLLIVDDVVSTGKSMEDQRSGRDAEGYAIFARVPLRHLPWWINALFTLDA